MLRRFIVTILLALGAIHASVASAVTDPNLPWISFVDGAGNSTSLNWVQTGHGYVIGAVDGDGNRVAVTQTLDVGTITYSGYMDPDPHISYSWGVTNTTTTTQFYSVTFGTPLVPAVAGANTVFASLAGGLTDAGDNGISFSLFNPYAQVSQLGFPLTDTGVGVGGGFSATGLGVLPARPYSYPSATVGPQAGPVSSWTFMQTTLAFFLTPGDSVALTGFVSVDPGTPVTPVPEPDTSALLLAGLLGCAIAVRRCPLRPA